MPYRLCFRVLAAATLITVGCGSPNNSTPPGPAPTKTGPNLFQTTSGAETSVPGETDAIVAFLEQDSSCREVLNGRSLADFLTEFTGATRDHEQSRHNLQYVVYRQSQFMYEFLDEKLFAIRFVVPRSRKSADDWIAPYQKAFGPPTTTQTPDDFQDVKASQFRSWDLPRHNLRVNFADLPASFGEADLDLFGQFMNLERAKEYLRRSASPDRLSTEPISLPSRALQRAFEVASQEEEQDPLVVELWTGIGIRCAQTGDTDATGHLLTWMEQKPRTALMLSCRAKIAAELVTVLAAAGRTEEAIAFADRISFTASQQRCAALSAIAIAREAKDRQSERDPLWNQAIDTVDQGANAQQRADNTLAIIQNLVNADRLAEAEVLAQVMETNLSNRSGWRPIAEKIAMGGDVDAAQRILGEKLAGLDQELSLFITHVLAERRFETRFELCRSTLRRIKNPVLLAQASCLLFGEMTESHQRTEARRELGLALERAEKARVSHRETAAILLSAIDPMAALEGQPAGLNICQTLKARFAPEFAAEGYRKLATHFVSEPTEVSRYLDMAEELARTVVVAEERLPVLRQIYRTRSAFLGEDDALRAIKNLKGPLDQGYAWLGIAEGLPTPTKH